MCPDAEFYHIFKISTRLKHFCATICTLTVFWGILDKKTSFTVNGSPYNFFFDFFPIFVNKKYFYYLCQNFKSFEAIFAKICLAVPCRAVPCRRKYYIKIFLKYFYREFLRHGMARHGTARLLKILYKDISEMLQMV